MDWKIAIAVVAGSALFCSAPATAQDEPETLAPVSSWTLDYDDDSCALSRVFGNEEAPLVFEMRQYAPATPFYATILSQRTMVAEPDIRLTFEGDTPSETADTLWMLDPGQGMRGFRTQLSTQAPRGEIPFAIENAERDAHEAAITYLDVTGAYDQPIRLQTGGMGPALAAMRDCSLGVLEEWSLDVEAHRSLSANVTSDPQRSGFQRVYRRMSTEMREQFVRGNLPVRLIIDTEGRVQSCNALVPFANIEQTSTFCEAATDYLRFIPAKNAAGEAIPSFEISGVYPLRTERRTAR
ncbi:MAG: hypothetical protein WBA68_08215 [Alteraurantiacibacter sp.]